MLSSGHGFESERRYNIEYPISSSVTSISDGIISRDLNVVILKKDTMAFKTGSSYPSDSDFFSEEPIIEGPSDNVGAADAIAENSFPEAGSPPLAPQTINFSSDIFFKNFHQKL